MKFSVTLEGQKESKLDGHMNSKSEGNAESKQGTRTVSKQEGRLKSKQEGRLKSKSEGRLKSKQEGRIKSKSEGRLRSKSEGRLKSKSEGRLKSKQETNTESKPEGNTESKTGNKKELASQGRIKSKPLGNGGSKQETQTESKPEGQKQSIPEDQIQSTPEGQIQSTPEGQIQSAPEGPLQSTPEGQIHSSPEGQIQSKPVGKIQSKPEGQIHSSPEGQIQLTPEGKIHSSPEGQIQSKSVGKIQSKPEGQIQSKPVGKIQSKPEGQIHSSPEVQIQSKPVGKIQSKPVGKILSKAEGQIQSKPEGKIQSIPENQIQSIPEDQIQSTPEGQLQSTPESQIQSTPEGQIHSTPEGQLQSTPEGQIHSSPEGQIQSKPVGKIQSKPEGQIHSSPEGQIQSTPEGQIHLSREGQIQSKPVGKIQSKAEGKTESACLKIDLTSAPDLLTDTSSFLIQVARNDTHVIFQIFINRVHEGQHIHYKCPYLPARPSRITVVVYVLENNKHSYTVRGGGKAAVAATTGTELSLKLTLNQCDPYLDLHIKDAAEISYCFDVECIGPEKYMMSNLEHLNPKNDAFIIIIHQSYPSLTYVILYTSTSNLTFPFSILPATVYSVVVFNVKIIPVDAFLGYSHSKMYQFRSCMTQNEIMELYFKAVRYLSRRPRAFDVIPHFYRNKSPEYFHDIMWNRMGVMHKYDKNWGGDQASTLNQNIKGLFFSSQIDPNTGRLPDFSYYGPVRLHVPSKAFLHQNMNMYFADFYCHYVNHKVQFVLTVKGSATDQFCSERLLLVDQEHNPFLVRVGSGHQSFIKVTKNITVELFYTEDVPIKTLMLLFPGQVFFLQTIQKGKAKSMVIGIPKNKDCKVCNLDCFLRARQAVHGR
ncbi:uncharacterized protein LOC110458461 [Mizuhopecten yessoensis]|uniref:uncharacterized protein LOC110458461 n=1 Tax=Mizuhopecten yessoensis TaxID=6573 RepID=UPI000B45B937|nr:uncharacterized protein LOC110458461 [Mizuhopecten yessoensis]XP_021365840.1 uncharacterized protein LOC110458461 [Mizuhopecten yessoensis]